MPAKGSTDPAMLPSRITTWLAENPGEHRTRDVATGLGAPEDMSRSKWTQKVANAMARLARDGAVARRDEDLGHKRPVGLYSALED